MPRVIHTPGQPDVVADGAPQDPSEDVAAELAALRAENAALKAKAELPQTVFEPETPHGKIARAASEFAHLTVAELMAKIDAGEAKEPFTSVLCADGYYTARLTTF
jgi:hypothetical protein